MQEHSFVDESGVELSQADSTVPLNGDDEDSRNSLRRTESIESDRDDHSRLHIWHIVVIAADRLLLILFLLIVIIIGIAALANLA